MRPRHRDVPAVAHRAVLARRIPALSFGEPRLAAGVEATALLRRAEQAGGFGAVLNKGDPERGAILLVMTERGRYVAILERLLQHDGSYHWGSTGPAEADSVAAAQYVARRRRTDPDCWVLELDVPSTERFIAEMTGVA
jgi:hypothetical protein